MDIPCPFCKASSERQGAAGEPGTFLGDSVHLCQECGKAYHIITNREVPLPATKQKGSKTAPLNPQYKINQKQDAVKKAGGELTYDRATRIWTLKLPKGKGHTLVEMSAQRFSEYDKETILKATAE